MPAKLENCYIMTLNVSLEYEKTEVSAGSPMNFDRCESIKIRRAQNWSQLVHNSIFDTTRGPIRIL